MNKRWATHRWWGLASVLIVLIVAAGFRFWQIGAIPPGLFGDEAADGLDALDVLAGRGQVFFPSNFGREGLHMWIVAASIKVLGVTPLALRIPSVIAGTIACLATLWLGWELFGFAANDAKRQHFRRWAALSAALLISASYWHVHFSRFGIRGVFTTAATALALAAFWRAVRMQRLRWFALAGLFLGLGTHFYTASRFVPVFLGIFALCWLMLSWLKLARPGVPGQPKRFVGDMALLFLVAAIVFAPLGYYFLTHPGSFAQRAGVVSAFGAETGSAWANILRAGVANLLQFIVPGAGDQAQFYNLPGRAVFDPIMAIFALLGLVISLRRIRQPAYLFLLLWFGLLVLPSFLATDRYPTLPRLLGVIPGVYFFPAIGLVAAWEWLVARLHLEKRSYVAPALLLIPLLLYAGLTYRDYFGRWGASPATAEAYEADMTAAWRWLKTHPPAGDVFLSADLYKHPTFMFLHEQTPTTEYFTRANPRLHWFDARSAWPLPNAPDSDVVLVGDSATPPAWLSAALGVTLDPLAGPAQRPYLQQAHTSGALTASADVVFSDQIRLMGQYYVPHIDEAGRAALVQLWQAAGPQTGSPRYQIQSALADAEGRQLTQASEWMGYWPTEWQAGGRFLTWQTFAGPGDAPPQATQLRLVPEGEPPLRAEGSDEGWVTLPLVTLAAE